jgi:hypothetical protein
MREKVEQEREREREREEEAVFILVAILTIEPIRKYRNPLIGPPHRMYI